jgi:ubiquinone/menaquinone biosynthesis C-methylase UbiE
MTADTSTRPGIVGRYRSRQSGHPSGLVGRIFGRVMVNDTAAANDQAIKLLHLTTPRTVLEVGFGQGRTAAALVERGHSVLGVDPSTTMVRQATARNRAACHDGRADLRHSDGTTIAFPDATADAAITVHTIYFMPDPTATFAEIARVLRPDATLVVACRTSDEPVPSWFDPDVYTFRTAADITTILHAAGFAQVEHHTDPGPTPPHTHFFIARRSGTQ